ncbi:MEDS domain-containing protein [Planosporangium sp. 12N6]|uniref:MEDS domain-containing protein n=1 Tax=Planosporangium spinosum TaxID=3402278 RepID=UPI003CE9CD42
MEVISGRPPGSEWDGHLLLLHHSDAELLSALATWARRGLSRGDKVVLAGASTPAQAAVLDRLRAEGADVDAAVADGRLATLPMDRFSSDGGRDAVVGRALAEGFPQVRMASEVGVTRDALPLSAHLHLERTIDRLCCTRPVSVLCQFRHSTTEPTMLPDLVTVHRYRLRDCAFSMAAGPDGLVLRGQIDRGNANVIAAVTEVATASGGHAVRLDLAAVEFIDVAACRQLLYVSQRFRESGGRVVLVDAQPSVDWTLRLFGVDEFPGVDLIGGRR